MNVWQFLAICGISFLLLEIFVPSMFFLNFALASFITAVISIWVKNPYALVIVFFVLSFASFILLRPVIMRSFCKSKETGINSKYIDKIAKVEEEVTDSSGVITIYGERWEARAEKGIVIPQGSEVKIVKNDSIIMFVQQI